MPILHYCPLADIALFICLFYSVSPPTSFSVVFPIVVVQSLSHVGLFATHGLQHTRLPYPSLSPGICSNSCPLSQWCSPTISSSTASFALSLSQHQGLFQWVSSSHQVAKLLELQLQHCPSNEYSGLISFRIDWFDLLAVQGTLESLLQHHSSKALVFQYSAFFIVQLSYLYMMTGKTSLTIMDLCQQNDVSAF